MWNSTFYFRRRMIFSYISSLSCIAIAVRCINIVIQIGERILRIFFFIVGEFLCIAYENESCALQQLGRLIFFPGLNFSRYFYALKNTFIIHRSFHEHLYTTTHVYTYTHSLTRNMLIPMPVSLKYNNQKNFAASGRYTML